MTLPPILQQFGCGEPGLETPIEYDPYATDPTFDATEESFLKDAMPLVETKKKEEITLESVVSRYDAEFSNVLQFEIGLDTRRDLADISGFVEFFEYWLTYASLESQPVYALTTGHLFYLHHEKSFEDLLSGAKPNQNEEILILKPLKTGITKWREWHPGKTSFLEECAYLNVEMLDDNALKELIQKSATEEFFRMQYKSKTGTDWQVPSPDPEWATEFLNRFKEYPDWPIIVRGGAQIASTRAKPNTTGEQRISMFFKLGGTWIDHEDKVKTFLKYQQRSYGISGHPLIAKILGHSVRSGTVDVIPSTFSQGYAIKRAKYKLIKDFELFKDSTDPTYHPLALDPDQDSHRLIVPKPPTGEIPPYLVPSLGPDHDWVTKLKIHNPLGLELNINREEVPPKVDIRLIRINPQDNHAPLSFNETEQVVEVIVTGDLPQDTTEPFEPVVAIATSDGTVIQELKLIFLEFRAVPVKFWKVRDNIEAHQTFMSEGRLDEVLSYANKILGSQTNVYIYPVEQNGKRLHDLPYDGDLGDPILEDARLAVSEPVAIESQREHANVLFAWNFSDVEWADRHIGVQYWVEVTEENGETRLVHLMAVDTKIKGVNASHESMAETLVHELGHWFSNNFIAFPNYDLELPECSDRDRHFSHSQDVYGTYYGGCPDGDWIFTDNLMAPGGTLFITVEQARVFNQYASLVVP